VHGSNLNLTAYNSIPKNTFIKMDSAKYQQLLSIIIGNAIKFTEEKGSIFMSVRINEEPNEHVVRNRSTDTIINFASILENNAWKAMQKQSQVPKNLVLETIIQDNGNGIDAEVLKILFRPFAQTAVSSSREYGGSGLGLAIVEKIVRLTNGELHVQSKLGKGSKFRILIPVHEAQSTEALSNQPITTVFKCNPVFGSSRTDATKVAQVVRSEPHILAKPLTQSKAPDCRDMVQFAEPSSTLHTHADHSVLPNISDVKDTKEDLDQKPSIATAITNQILFKSIESATDVPSPDDRNINQTLAAEEPPADDSIHILMVDDSDMNRKIMKKMIEKIVPEPNRLKIQECVNGQEAVDRVVSYGIGCNFFRVIFMDVCMPVKDGFDATRDIRKLGYTTPIIIATANRISQDASILTEIDAQELLCKPFLKENVLNMLIKHQVLR